MGCDGNGAVTGYVGRNGKGTEWEHRRVGVKTAWERRGNGLGTSGERRRNIEITEYQGGDDKRWGGKMKREKVKGKDAGQG